MTDLDTLMNLDPLNLTRENVDDLISHYRRQRAGGGKRAEKEIGPKVTLQDLGLKPEAPKLAIRRL